MPGESGSTKRAHQAEAIVRKRLLRVLQGKAPGVVRGLPEMASKRGVAGTARERLPKCEVIWSRIWNGFIMTNTWPTSKRTGSSAKPIVCVRNEHGLTKNYCKLDGVAEERLRPNESRRVGRIKDIISHRSIRAGEGEYRVGENTKKVVRKRASGASLCVRRQFLICTH